ncbi:unnamed protein product [Phytophthora lilii]|uniref:Unnamed protein product n=1 Tax=Phytophthora lilii TaxID=2077276 RepID=A0A9W6TFZ5_9STRA|nr:unnamed protein product [Phytophthora lilii]
MEEMSMGVPAEKLDNHLPRKSNLLAILPSSRQNGGEAVSAASFHRHNDAQRGIPHSARTSHHSLKRGSSGLKVSPRSNLPIDEAPIPQLVLDPYSEQQSGRHSSRSKSGRHPTLADMLWKRSNSSVDLLRRNSGKIRQTLKSRHSLPAGTSASSVTCGANEMPLIPDEHDAATDSCEAQTSLPSRGCEHSYREYQPPSSRGSSRQSNPDPRCLKIEE